MSEKYSLQGFANACDWEGGLLNAVFGYGLGPDDVEDPGLADLLRELLKVEPIVIKIQALLPEPGEDA